MKKIIISISFLLFMGSSFGADSLSYTGRLVNANGSPVTGPVNLRLDLVYTDDTSAIVCTKDISSVPLSNGVFHLKIDYSTVDCGGKSITQVLADSPAAESVAIRVTDLVHSKTYSFHAIHSLPYASVSTLSKNIIQMGASSGQVLAWDGSKWAPTDAGGEGSVTSVATGDGLTGGPITETGTISILDGGVTAAKLNQMGAALGNVLKWNGANWAPSTDGGLTAESDPTVQGYAKNSVPVCDDNQALKFDALLNAGAGGLFCNNLSLDSDEITEGSVNKFFTDARARTAAVADTINDGTTDIAPSQNAVFDGLALKQNSLNNSSDVEVGSLSILGTLSGSSGTEHVLNLSPIIDQTSTAGYTGLFMNVTETGVGSGTKKLIDLQVGGVSKFSVDTSGAVVTSTANSGTSANYTSTTGNQLTVGFDSSSKTTVDVDSLGFTTFSASGVGSGYNFAGGNVGIGVLAPSEALDVTGNVKASVGVIAPMLSNLTDLSLTADSDNNTSGDLIFRTGLQEKMRITNSGLIGVGTSTPTDILTLKQEDPFIRFLMGGSGTTQGGLRFFSDTTTHRGTIGYTNTKGIGIIGTVSNSSLTLDGVGSAVIASDSPSLRFNDSSGSPSATIDMSSGASLRYIGGAVSPELRLSVLDSSDSDLILDNQRPGRSLLFNTTPTAGSSTERLRINSDGNVGIGTNTPSSPLVVSEGGYDVLKATANFAIGRASGGGGGSFTNLPAFEHTSDMDFRFRASHTNYLLRLNTAGSSGALWSGAPTTFSGENFTVQAPTLSLEGSQGIGHGRLVLRSLGADVLQVSGGNAERRVLIGLGTLRDYGSRVNITSRNTGESTMTLGAVSAQTADLLQVRSFGATDGDLFKINSQGQVGIGTALPTKTLYTLGNALIKSSVSEASAFEVQSAGGTVNLSVDTANVRVGVGTATPVQKLHVFGGRIRATSASGGIELEDSSGAYQWSFLTRGTSNRLALYNNANEYMSFLNNGNIGIGNSAPAYKLDVDGDINATGVVRSAGSALTSDRRLKEKLTSVNSSLEKISQLKAYNYYWKDKKKYGERKQLGLVAQDVEKVFPEAIQKDSKGFMAVSYANLVAPVIEAVKELSEKVFSNEKRLSEIEKKLDNRVPASSELAEIKAENKMMRDYICNKDPKAPFCKK